MGEDFSYFLDIILVNDSKWKTYENIRPSDSIPFRWTISDCQPYRFEVDEWYAHRFDDETWYIAPIDQMIDPQPLRRKSSVRKSFQITQNYMK